MTLTTTILFDNGFVLTGDIWTLTSSTPAFVISYDSVFQLIYNDTAYPMVTTVEDANDRLLALAIPFNLV